MCWKTYSLVKEGSVGIDILSEKKNPGPAQLSMVPVKRQKVRSLTVDLGKIAFCGLAARGLKLSQKAVERAELLPEKEKVDGKAHVGGLLEKASRIAPSKPAPKKKGKK
jgi:hypothetical protein